MCTPLYSTTFTVPACGCCKFAESQNLVLLLSNFDILQLSGLFLIILQKASQHAEPRANWFIASGVVSNLYVGWDRGLKVSIEQV